MVLLGWGGELQETTNQYFEVINLEVKMQIGKKKEKEIERKENLPAIKQVS